MRFFANMLAITALHCQKRTSLYTFGSEFRHCRNIAFDVTGGIHAASENPRRIRTDKDGSGSKLQQVFSSEKLVVEQRTRTYAIQQACGTFLPNSLHLLRLLAKRLIQKLPQIAAFQTFSTCSLLRPVIF